VTKCKEEVLRWVVAKTDLLRRSHDAEDRSRKEGGSINDAPRSSMRIEFWEENGGEPFDNLRLTLFGKTVLAGKTLRQAQGDIVLGRQVDSV